MKAVFSRPLDVDIVGAAILDIALNGLKSDYVTEKKNILSEEEIRNYPVASSWLKKKMKILIKILVLFMFNIVQNSVDISPTNLSSI